ncbi:unnamed protein product [Calypogeia fissa]
MGDDNRHEMMESLFGAESGGSDDEPDNKSSYSNDSNATNSARDDEEGEGEGGGEVEVESDLDGAESERGAGSDGGRDVESEAERGGVSDRDEVSDREVEEGEPDVESEAERGGASDRDEASDREVEEVEGSVSGSETSHRGGAVEYDDHEVDLAREPSERADDELGDEYETEQLDDEQGENEHGDDEQVEDEPIEDEQVADELGEDEQGENEQVGEAQDDDEQQASGGVAAARDVFGDSDEDDEEVLRRPSLSREASPLASPENALSEERSDQEGEVPDDFVGDEGRYDSEDELQAERKREKPVGPPLELEVPLKPPPGRADQLNLVRVSNIMGIESKPFDPKTYEEESTFVTDADGRKQRLRLEENVARWRIARNRDGTTSYESNARFVKWSDGSMQLHLGNEVLDLAVQDSRHDQSHLFIRHPKSLLQSQGRLLHKMKFMPSSLTSKSHKLLTALVDSRNKKVLKVKSVVTNIDPDKEKEGQEKAVEQRIRSKSDLQRKQDKISRKYSHIPSSGRDTELSSGYLEGALEEEEEADDYDRGSRRHMDQRRFQQQLDAERGAERRIMNAKRQPPPLRRPPVSKRPAPSRRESMRDVLEEEESAYETDPEDEDEEMDDEDRAFIDEDEEEEPRRHSEKGRAKDRGERRQNDRDDEDKKRRRDPSPEPELSPPRKSTQRRRVVVSESDEDD